YNGRGVASTGSGGRIDLKQYLPGGARDPRLMGGMRPPGTQIHNKFVDIWGRISVRMVEKCRLGILAGCG
ncbi:MAG: hypothetical protein KF799_15600, partial [Bdellovibrionales bacterium]|nr:hypothetical protein [Bdellovibrionales bacterium]